MNNADMPAAPNRIESIPYESVPLKWPHGLTKREQACLTMGVADTGDAELDAIITKGNKNKFAGLAMQGLLAHYGSSDDQAYEVLARYYADELLKELGQDNE